jgi:hypothetical protein
MSDFSDRARKYIVIHGQRPHQDLMQDCSARFEVVLVETHSDSVL